MSKLVNTLKRVDETRKDNGNILVEDAREEPKPVPAVREHKGIYFIGFLAVILIAFSAMSTSFGLKTLSRLEKIEAAFASISVKAENDSTRLLQALKGQEKDVRTLEAFIAGQNSEEAVRMTELQDQVRELKIAIEVKESMLSGISTTRDSMTALMQNSIDDLKIADRLMLKKFILLNGKVKQLVSDDVILNGALAE